MNIRQLQIDLKELGFDPGPIDGIMGRRTRAAMKAYAAREGLEPTHPGFEERLHEDAREQDLAIPESFNEDTDGDGIPDTEDALPAVPRTVDTVAPIIHRVKGKVSNRKGHARNLKKKQRAQIHITDYWAGESCVGMKTNLYVSEEKVYEVHPVEAIIIKNYDDLYHIEVEGVTEERRVVEDKEGRTHTRRVMEWMPERESILEMAMVYTVELFRAKGIEIEFITHRQTYKRPIDPEKQIAQAAYRIAQKHGFRLDFDYVRGSGQSAAKWYPAGCGKLG